MIRFVSLLGTNPYKPCNYYLGNNIVKNCRYIQKALVEILVNQGIKIDKVSIFTTEESYNKNWITSKDGNAKLGLKDELYKLSEENGFQVENIIIPEGHSEEELWDIFRIILEQLEENDEIILDITHSFRYLPMLTFIIINYARIVKRCSLKAVYYGAFEVLGPANTVEELPLEKRNAPIFDLTSFIDLFDWTIAIDRYLATGDASLVEKLTSKEVKKINAEINEEISKKGLISNSERPILFRDPNSLRELSNSMKNFSEIVSTCRGRELTKAISSLKNNIDVVTENASHEKIKPLSPVIKMLKDRFENFSHDNDFINVIETAKWCYDNKMYQQGLTILEEGIISYICNKWGLCHIDENDRKKVTSHAYDVTIKKLNAYYILGMGPKNANDLLKLLYNIADIRNDINHAGWREKFSPPSTFESKIKDFVKRAESLILNAEKNLKEKRMLLIFSHKLTEIQKKEAKQRFSISKFIELDDELSKKWANIPPDLEDLMEYLEDIRNWIDNNARAGDYALVQGDFGAANIIVNYCKSKGIIPVYATTERKTVEEKNGEHIKISREFEHVMFRKYQ